MKNLSPIGAIHSPIDSDRDVSAYSRLLGDDIHGFPSLEAAAKAGDEA